MTQVSLESNAGRERKTVWSRKDEEYAADFCLVSQRVLDSFEHRIFRYHFLLGADWKLCCRKLNLDRGTFFHTVYRVQQRLGRVFRELRPYALYPLDEYFQSTTRHEALRPVTKLTVMPLRAPLAPRPLVPTIAKAA